MFILFFCPDLHAHAFNEAQLNGADAFNALTEVIDLLLQHVYPVELLHILNLQITFLSLVQL